MYMGVPSSQVCISARILKSSLPFKRERERERALKSFVVGPNGPNRSRDSEVFRTFPVDCTAPKPWRASRGASRCSSSIQNSAKTPPKTPKRYLTSSHSMHPIGPSQLYYLPPTDQIVLCRLRG